MGVRGLTTYIADNAKSYLKPYELCDTYLVVDGNNIAAHLYKWVSKADNAFGGDYDEFYKTVKTFFSSLLQCGVTPIVLLDGGYEKRKIRTILSRSAAKLPIIRSFCRGFSTTKFSALFNKQTFIDVMHDLGIFCVQCDLEADIEIASMAKILNCPVLSYDSDFYIFDVLYIPFSLVEPEPVRVESQNKAKFYIKCSIYDVSYFLNEFPGLDKSLLPIIATLLGNDYLPNSIFNKFFSHVIIPKNRNMSYTQRRIHGILHWLKKETLESATKLILSHLEDKKAKKVMQVFEASIKDYTEIVLSSSVIAAIHKHIPQYNSIKIKEKTNETRLPLILNDLFGQCFIDKLIIDMINHATYFTSLQIENVYDQSSHYPSLRLITVIYSLLTPFIKKNPQLLKIYLTIKNQYRSAKVENVSIADFSKYNLSKILMESKETRLKLLYDFVGMNDENLKIISVFKDSWIIFVMSFLYWLNKLNNRITPAQIHALILMTICNKVVQTKVGYYRNSGKFLKNKGQLLAELSNTQVEVKDEPDTDFEKLLENVTMYECLILQQSLIPLRQTTEKGKSKSYSILSLHAFACFQSILFHIMKLNALLNFPLPHLKVCDYYSGTLLFNLYLNIIHKPFVEKTGHVLLQNTPNIEKVYKFLCEKLATCSVETTVKVKKKHKRSRNLELKEVVDDEIVLFYEQDDEDYEDENNIYSLLQNVAIN